MTNYRLADSVARKLRAIDNKIDARTHKWLSGGSHKLDYDDLEAKGTEILRAAAKRLNIVKVNVADGFAYYFEIKRTKTMVTFQWLYGGADCYVSPWGKIVAIPIHQANKLILKPKEIY